MNRNELLAIVVNRASTLSTIAAQMRPDRYSGQVTRPIDVDALRNLRDEITTALGQLSRLPVNMECPARCDDLDCEASDSDHDYVAHCERTDSHWRWCDVCNGGGWQYAYGRYVDDPQHIDGQLLCDPYTHDYRSCDDCGGWVHYDDVRYAEDDEYGDYSYCPRCYDTHVEAVRQPEPARRCDTCHSDHVHLDELTEQFLCDHAARDAIARKRRVILATVGLAAA